MGDQPTSSDHLVDTEIMLQDTLFLCLVGVGMGQIVSFRNQQSFRSPSGIIGFDANGRVSFLWYGVLVHWQVRKERREEDDRLLLQDQQEYPLCSQDEDGHHPYPRW